MDYKETNYICIDPLLSEVKQELKAYFEVGALTDAMVPTYVNQALRKLKHITLKRESVVLNFQDFKSRLPEDFYLLNWAASYEIANFSSHTLPTSTAYFYSSIVCEGNCSSCFSCDPKFEVYEQITLPSQTVNSPLRLINPRALKVYFGSKDFCSEDCPNTKPLYLIHDTITIEPTLRVSASFREGCIVVNYMSKPLDEQGLPMIPEQYEIEEFVKSHVKFKFFEQLFNSVTDESFNQIKMKFDYYRQDSYNKFIAAKNINLFYGTQQLADNSAKDRLRYKKFHIN